MYEIDNNLYAFFKCIVEKTGSASQSEFEEFTLSGFDIFNHVFNLHWHSNLSEDRINCILEYFDRLSLRTNWFIPVTEDSVPIMRCLEKHGFLWQSSLVAMYLHRPLPSINYYNFELQTVRGHSSFRLWIETLIAGFEICEKDRNQWVQLLSGLYLHPNWRHYLGYVQDLPCFTCSTFNNESSVGVYWVSTKPIFRNQNLATIFLTNLLEVLFKNNKHIFLHSTAMGLPLYKKIGFVETHSVQCYSSPPKVLNSKA